MFNKNTCFPIPAELAFAFALSLAYFDIQRPKTGGGLAATASILAHTELKKGA